MPKLSKMPKLLRAAGKNCFQFLLAELILIGILSLMTRTFNPFEYEGIFLVFFVIISTVNLVSTVMEHR